MYEHMHLFDSEGHVACGVLACLSSILTALASFQRDETVAFFDAFVSFVRLELEVRFFVDVNTGEYRDHVESLLAPPSDRSCQTLLRALSVPSADALGAALLHSRVAVTCRGSNPGLAGPTSLLIVHGSDPCV